MKSLRSDTGAAMVTVAISLVLLMGMAAIAIDSGILFNDRRQQQSAADGGALAAVQFAKTTLPTAMCTAYSGFNLATCRGAEEAIDVVNGTLNNRYTNAAWAACTDPGRPAEFTRISPITPCVSFTQNFQKARVRMPGTDVETTFGKVIGFNSARVGAFAHATADLNQSAEVIPFAVGPTGAGSSHACLFANSSSNLNAYPCNGPVQGNFGKLDLSVYGNSTLGTVEICGNANPTLKIASNLIVGIDHILEIASSSPGTVNDFANCPILTNPVDNLPTQTGNSANGIENGLFNGISTPSREGRLMCKGGLSSSTGGEDPSAGKVSSACVAVNNNMPENLDHTPLWEYIAPGASAESGGACVPSITNRIAMENCLIAWRAWGVHTTYLFDADIRESPRFAAVPILTSDPSVGTGNYDIIAFRPVYLETLYLKCTANTCDIIHSPGESSTGACPASLMPTDASCGWPQNGNKGIVALSSFMMTLDMLHPDVAANFPSVKGTLIFNLSN